MTFNDADVEFEFEQYLSPDVVSDEEDLDGNWNRSVRGGGRVARNRVARGAR